MTDAPSDFDPDDYWHHWMRDRAFHELFVQTRDALAEDCEDDSFRQAVLLLCGDGRADDEDLPAISHPLLDAVQLELRQPGGLAAACFRRLQEPEARYYPDLVENAQASEMMENLGRSATSFPDEYISRKVERLTARLWEKLT